VIPYKISGQNESILALVVRLGDCGQLAVSVSGYMVPCFLSETNFFIASKRLKMDASFLLFQCASQFQKEQLSLSAGDIGMEAH
jgi:hypothetical protein